MLNLISRLSEANVLVIGDVMLDRYWKGDCRRISPEAPVPVVRVTDQSDRLGGAGNVALNIHALGARCVLSGAVGVDESAIALRKVVEDAGISAEWVASQGYSTIIKQRIVSANHQLIRLDFENTVKVPDLSAKVYALTEPYFSKVSGVVLSDYAKGVLQDPQLFIAAAKRHGIPIFVDPKSDNFEKYRGATVLTPNRREFEAALGPCADQTALAEQATRALTQYDLEALLITLGAEGMLLVQRDHPPFHLPACAREVFDVTGAGDTVIAVLAAAISSGASYRDAVQLANVAASIAVEHFGTSPVKLSELRVAMAKLHEGVGGVVSERDLIAAVANAKAQGERIVMTNGCFDLLHVGHVSYLQQARALGDRLIVAVNSDESVKRLKGNARPLNNLASRMQVLSALRSVDWVVDFTEDTPQRLISQVLPDILVKGEDYLGKEIAGSREVIANGGTVQLMPFVDGYSTTNLLKKSLEVC